MLNYYDDLEMSIHINQMNISKLIDYSIELYREGNVMDSVLISSQELIYQTWIDRDKALLKLGLYK